MNLSNQKVNFSVGTKILTDSSPQEIGESFVVALTTKDFHTLEYIFHPQVYFRGLVPSNLRNGSTAGEAVRWLRDWFGDEETIEVLQSSIDMLENILSMQYRLRVFDNYGGWQVIEQHAYCVVQEGRITEMRLVCSGFLPAPNDSKESGSGSQQAPVPRLGGTLFYDAGSKGCAEGPLDDIARLMRQLDSGQTLEIHATDPSVAGDLPAWCHLSGHELVQSEDQHFLIRHK